MTTGFASGTDIPTHQVRRVFGTPNCHTDSDLLAATFTNEGRLWSLEETGVLRLWDVVEQKQIEWYTLDDAAAVWGFSQGGHWLAGGARGVTVWETASGEELSTWPQDSWVTALAFSADGRLLAVGHDDGVVRIWDWRDVELLHELRGCTLAVSALCFRLDSQLVAAAGEDRSIILWEVAGGIEVGRLTGHTDRIPALTWHPDGKRLISAGWDTTARVWDVPSCKPIILLNSHAAQVTTLALNRDGSRLACVDSEHVIHLWDMDIYKPLDVLRDRAFADVRCLAFHPGGRRLVFGGAERVLGDWDLDAVPVAPSSGNDVFWTHASLGISLDATRFYRLTPGKSLEVWDTDSGEPAESPIESTPLTAFALSHDGRWLTAGLARNPGQCHEAHSATLALWDARTGARLDERVEQRRPIVALAFSPDSTAVAAISQGSSDVWLWKIDGPWSEAPALEPLLLLNNCVENCVVEATAWHPAGRRIAVAALDILATGGNDGQIAIWDIQRRSCVNRLPGGAVSVSWHPDGQQLASASQSGAVMIWDAVSGMLLHELHDHLDTVVCVHYSPDGRWLASASDDHTLRLWNADTAESCGMVELPTQILDLAFSPDSQHLYTANANGSSYQLEVGKIVG